MAYSFEYLKTLREFEYYKIKKFLPSNGRILEIGAGAGYQAKIFSEDGYNVSAIDMETSVYAKDRVFDVLNYDGKNIPFLDCEFDVIYSSSVLEHVSDLGLLHKEIKRVLRPGGVIIHVLPSATWRTATLISGYLLGCMNFISLVGWCTKRLLIEKSIDRTRAVGEWRYMLNNFWNPPRHGETGNAFSEILYFSRLRWLKHFKKNEFIICICKSAGILYSGNMLFAEKLSIGSRVLLSRLLGSACLIYVLKVREKKYE